MSSIRIVVHFSYVDRLLICRQIKIHVEQGLVLNPVLSTPTGILLHHLLSRDLVTIGFVI